MEIENPAEEAAAPVATAAAVAGGGGEEVHQEDMVPVIGRTSKRVSALKEQEKISILMSQKEQLQKLVEKGKATLVRKTGNVLYLKPEEYEVQKCIESIANRDKSELVENEKYRSLICRFFEGKSVSSLDDIASDVSQRLDSHVTAEEITKDHLPSFGKQFGDVDVAGAEDELSKDIAVVAREHLCVWTVEEVRNFPEHLRKAVANARKLREDKQQLFQVLIKCCKTIANVEQRVKVGAEENNNNETDAAKLDRKDERAELSSTDKELRKSFTQLERDEDKFYKEMEKVEEAVKKLEEKRLREDAKQKAKDEEKRLKEEERKKKEDEKRAKDEEKKAKEDEKKAKLEALQREKREKELEKEKKKMETELEREEKKKQEELKRLEKLKEEQKKKEEQELIKKKNMSKWLQWTGAARSKSNNGNSTEEAVIDLDDQQQQQQDQQQASSSPSSEGAASAGAAGAATSSSSTAAAENVKKVTTSSVSSAGASSSAAANNVCLFHPFCLQQNMHMASWPYGTAGVKRDPNPAPAEDVLDLLAAWKQTWKQSRRNTARELKRQREQEEKAKNDALEDEDLYVIPTTTTLSTPGAPSGAAAAAAASSFSIVPGVPAGAVTVVKRRYKLLQFRKRFVDGVFFDAVRPPYYGTFSKLSRAVKGKNPFNKDESIDYENDSEEEWGEEEEGGAEDISDSEGDDDEKDEEVDDEDGFVVPDDVIDGDAMDEEGEGVISNKPGAAAAAGGGVATTTAAKKKIAPLQPRAIGPVFYDADSVTQCDDASYARLLSFKTIVPVYKMETSVDAAAASSGAGNNAIFDEQQLLAIAAAASGSSSANGASAKKVKWDDALLPELVKMIHGSARGVEVLSREFVAAHPEVSLLQVSKQITRIAVKEKRGNDKMRFYVKADAVPFELPAIVVEAKDESVAKKKRKKPENANGAATEKESGHQISLVEMKVKPVPAAVVVATGEEEEGKATTTTTTTDVVAQLMATPLNTKNSTVPMTPADGAAAAAAPAAVAGASGGRISLKTPQSTSAKSCAMTPLKGQAKIQLFLQGNKAGNNNNNNGSQECDISPGTKRTAKEQEEDADARKKKQATTTATEEPAEPIVLDE